jgi:DNA-binding transcriptional LysR family regulator
MNIYSLDLNLLKIFDAVSSEGSVSRAAVRLGLTQPSVSNGLRRLRGLFADPLFERAPGGMAPTALARRLSQAIGDALQGLQGALDEGEQFDAATARRTFRLHMSDFGEVVFLPRLIKALAKRAPGVTLETMQLAWADLPGALDAGAIDLALGYLPVLGSEFHHHKLFREQYVLLQRARRAGQRAPARPRFIAVSSHPPSLQFLVEHGLRDRVALTVPHFMVVPAILAEVDLAVVVPRMAAERFASFGRYSLSGLAGARPGFEVGLHWSARVRGDAAVRWLRELLVELFAQ